MYQIMEYEIDYVLCECDLEPLKELVLGLEADYTVRVTKEPSICLTMVRAEDSLERQEFYLGEALTSECEVDVDGRAGFGLCLGEEPERCYCIAVLDAFLQGGLTDPRIDAFVEAHDAQVSSRDREDYARALSTRVDFKLMEED